MGKKKDEWVITSWSCPALEEVLKKWPISFPQISYDSDLTCIDSQVRHQLMVYAQLPVLGYDIHIWAFEMLEKIARAYQEKFGLGSLPPDMANWASLVFSGAVQRPKRGRGRGKYKNKLRNAIICYGVALLRCQAPWVCTKS